MFLLLHLTSMGSHVVCLSPFFKISTNRPTDVYIYHKPTPVASKWIKACQTARAHPIVHSCTVFIARLRHLFTAQRRFLGNASGEVNWTSGRMRPAQRRSLTLLYRAPAINASATRAKGTAARPLATEITAASAGTPEKNIKSRETRTSRPNWQENCFCSSGRKRKYERRWGGEKVNKWGEGMVMEKSWEQ